MFIVKKIVIFECLFIDYPFLYNNFIFRLFLFFPCNGPAYNSDVFIFANYNNNIIEK